MESNLYYLVPSVGEVNGEWSNGMIEGKKRSHGACDVEIDFKALSLLLQFMVSVSLFRDWCAETTNFSRELAEAALAHVLTDKTEAAYQRGDLFEKRRKLMEDWERYCLSGK